jgi:outer membrane protein assembly factor BamE
MRSSFRQFSAVLFMILALPLAGGCALYKPQIQQGNLVTAEQMAQLKNGMTRVQVQAVLGAPLLASMFHSNRWDYLYRVQKGSEITESRQLVLTFDGDKLVKFEGDPAPSERDAARFAGK